MPVKLINLPHITKNVDQRLSETIQNMNEQLPTFQVDAPPPVIGLQVNAADGGIAVAITDNGLVTKGIEYFIEWDTDPQFPQPHVVHLGPAREWNAWLGNKTIYVRAYSQYGSPVNSLTSTPFVFGGAKAPTAVVLGGALSGPTIPPSTGSGTGSRSGQNGGIGYGIQQSSGGTT